MKAPLPSSFSGSPSRLWQAQRSGAVMLIVSVLVVGFLCLQSVQRGLGGYRHLTDEVVPVTAALERLRFSALGMISSVSELGMIAGLEPGVVREKASAMVAEVREFNQAVDGFNLALSDYRELAGHLYPLDGAEVERVFYEGNRLKHQTRELLTAVRDQQGGRTLFAMKESLEATERRFFSLVSDRLEHQQREVKAANERIAAAQERLALVLVLGSLFLIGLVLFQRRRIAGICRACRKRPTPDTGDPFEPGPPSLQT